MRAVTTLALLFLISTAAAAQEPRESLAAAAARAGRELAKATPPEAEPAEIQTEGKADWRRVSRLRKGLDVRVITRDGLERDGRVGDVTGDRVVLLSVSALPSAARRALLDVAANYPGYIGRKPAFTHERLRVDLSGIFYDGVRVADAATIFTEVARDEIAEIKRRTRGSLPGALAGLGGGFALGYLNFVRLIYKPCGGNCNGEMAEMAASLVGLPILGAYLGARYTPHTPWTTVYRSR
jgi:hypothetical protein